MGETWRGNDDFRPAAAFLVRLAATAWSRGAGAEPPMRERSDGEARKPIGGGEPPRPAGRWCAGVRGSPPAPRRGGSSRPRRRSGAAYLGQSREPRRVAGGGCIAGAEGPPGARERPRFCAAASSSSGVEGMDARRVAGYCLPSEPVTVRAGCELFTSFGETRLTHSLEHPTSSAICPCVRFGNSLTAISTHRRLSALLRRWPWL